MLLKFTVYADVLFLINFVINMLLLSVTAMISKYPAGLIRKILSASVGAVYSVLMFLPEMDFAGRLPGKLLLLVTMTFVAFGYVNIRTFLKHICLFGGVSLMCGGCVLAYTCFAPEASVAVNNGIVYFNTSPITVIVCAFLCVPVMKIISAVYRRHKNRDYRSILVYKDGKSALLRVMIDTGNMLTDPLSGDPVVVAEKSALGGIVPENIDPGDIEALASCVSGVRIIPFRSLGCESGIMAGFRPDKIYCDRIVNENITLAVTTGRLSSDGQYNAIAGPESFEK